MLDSGSRCKAKLTLSPVSEPKVAPISTYPKADPTRQKILDAAHDCFADKGLVTSMRAIARRAGVDQALVHYHFGTKEKLFEAVLANATSQYIDAQEPQWALPEGDLKFVTMGVVVLFRWLGQHRQVVRLSAWARLEGIPFDNGPMRSLAQLVRERFIAAQSRGVLRADVDIDATMLCINSLINGFWDRYDEYSRFPAAFAPVEERGLHMTMELILRGTLVPECVDEAMDQAREAIESTRELFQSRS